MMPSITIRPEGADDNESCESLLRDAFWDLYRPGCVEHLIWHQLRHSSDLVPGLNLVAEEAGAIVGCIAGSRAQVVSDDQNTTAVLYLGPLAVRPGLQGRGVGSSLLGATLTLGRDHGFGGAFPYGDPAYYARFGFANAATWQVTTADGHNFDAFMGTELVPHGLAGVSGRLVESTAFEVDPVTVEAFDSRFPRRPSHITSTQLH